MEGCVVEVDKAKLGVTEDLIMVDEVIKVNGIEDNTGFVESEVVKALIEVVTCVVTTDVVNGLTVVSGTVSEFVVTPTVVGVVMTLVVEDTTVEEQTTISLVTIIWHRMGAYHK